MPAFRQHPQPGLRSFSGYEPPDWLKRKLILTETQAYAAAGDAESALTSAGRVEPSEALEAAVAHSRALLAAGDREAASRVMARAPTSANGDSPSSARLEARLVEAELSCRTEDLARGRQWLEQALRLAEREQLPRRWRRPAHVARIFAFCAWNSASVKIPCALSPCRRDLRVLEPAHRPDRLGHRSHPAGRPRAHRTHRQAPGAAGQPAGA